MFGKLIYYTKTKETVSVINMNKIVYYFILIFLFVIGFLIGVLGTEGLLVILDVLFACYSFIATILLFIKSSKQYDELFIYEYGIRGQGIVLNNKKSKVLEFELPWEQVASIELSDKGMIIKTNNNAYSLNVQKPRDVADIVNMYLLKQNKE